MAANWLLHAVYMARAVVVSSTLRLCVVTCKHESGPRHPVEAIDLCLHVRKAIQGQSAGMKMRIDCIGMAGLEWSLEDERDRVGALLGVGDERL